MSELECESIFLPPLLMKLYVLYQNKNSKKKKKKKDEDYVLLRCDALCHSKYVLKFCEILLPVSSG
jgi:hypothetical protein